MSPEQIATLAELVYCNGFDAVLAELRAAAAGAADHANDIGDSRHRGGVAPMREAGQRQP